MKKTDTNKVRMLRALKKHKGLVRTACKAAKISKSAYYQWYHEDEAFQEAVDEIMDLEVEYVESKLQTLIDNEVPSAVLFYLKNKSENYKPSLQIDAKVEGEIKVNAIFNTDLIKDTEE